MSEPEVPSRWRVRLGLALAAFFGAVLALGALGAGVGEVAAGDPDVWWVAAAGRLGSWLAPLATNTFSFTAPDRPWVFHEHLAGPLYAFGLEHGGTSFLSMLSLVGLLGTAALVLFAGTRWQRPNAHELFAGWCLALVWCLAVGLHGMNARVTILARLLPLAFVLLGFGERFERRHALALVGLATIWANLHGSFPLGPTILVAAGFEGHRRARWATALLCGLASFVTPHGLALHTLVYDYLVGGAATLDVVHTYVREFQPLWAVDPLTIVPELIALVIVSTIALLGLRSHPARTLLLLALVVLATRNQRHLPLVLLLAVPLLRPVLASWVPSWQGAARPALAVAFLPAFVLGGFAWLKSPAPEARGGAVVDALVARLPEGTKLYVPIDLGGRVAWAAHPRVHVFADPRNDCYPADVLREAYELGRPGQDPAWIRETLAARDVTHVLERAGSDVARALDAWRFVVREGEWVLLESPDAMALNRRASGTSGPPARRARR
ncbi:MAG: hypothetical protein H6721_13835 [Sandaracinus sp.]|nr:hypothetical protein [Sandaracinus sp.]MCB9633197.1 hypothetical protein [Sandaracinus sp.]